MSRQARTPAEISAMVEAGIARGLNVIDAFTAATGNRTLDRAHKKELATQKSARRKHQARVESFRFGAVAGGGTAIAGGALAIVISNPALWLIAVGGAVISIMSIRGWRRLGPEPVGRGSVAPATPLPRGAIGRDCVKRYLAVRTQVVNMSSGVSVLHPAAGKELVNADAQAAVALNTLCDRLLVLHQLAASLPGTAAAASAASAAQVVASRLALGCDSYDKLLAAAAELLASPDIAGMVNLQPAADSLIAYSHGLMRASDL
ncbi:MAG: hypothetical protein OR995_08925 [Candidatus Nanopelagicales bacterium]|nr:hypothetical protein [Candidatus Nanopelagicales bacterium]